MSSPTPNSTVAAAASVATTLQALATPSRLLILSQLRHVPRAVHELAQAQRIVYQLHDHHVDEAVYHSERLRLGVRDPGTASAGY